MSLFPGVAYRPPLTTATPYVGSQRDGLGPQPGTVGILAYMIEQAKAIAVEMGINPDTIRVRSMGIYNPRRTASGIWSVHRDGRAWDLGIAVTRNGHRVMVELLRRIGPNAHRLGFQYGIFSRSQTRAGGWVAYGTRGDRLHDHDDHLHGEQTPAFAAIPAPTMIATCRRVLGDWRATDTGDDDMSAAVEGIQRTLNAAGFTDDDGAVLTVDGSWGPKTETAFATQTRAAARHLTAVGDVQTGLNEAGFRDGRGRPLTVDGWWGQRTAEAYAASLAPGLIREQTVTLTPAP